jgi:hypothetical protein
LGLSFSGHQSTMLYPKNCGSLPRATGRNLSSVVGDFSLRRVFKGEHAGASLEVDMTLRSLIGGVAFAAGSAVCVCSASAADLPPAPRQPAVAPVVFAPPVYNWTGIYVGGNLGGGFANSSWSDPFTGGTNSFSKDGFIGGGQIGGNLQYNWLVVGIEGISIGPDSRAAAPIRLATR